MHDWKRQNFGVWMIAASMVVTAFVLVIVLHHERDLLTQQVRAQGGDLSRALSVSRISPLTAQEQGYRPLQALTQGPMNPDLAYITVRDTLGTVHHELTAAGVLAPEFNLPTTPASWVGQSERALPSDGRAVMEFHAPVLRQGELVGFIQVGMLRPGLDVSAGKAGMFANIAMAIFLLTLVYYLLIRRETKPLSNLTRQLELHSAENGFQKLDLIASGCIGAFVQNFNRLAEDAQGRMRDLETRNEDALVATRVLAYKRARLESVLDALPDAVLVLDAEGIISFVNAKCATLFQSSEEDMTGTQPHLWCKNSKVLGFIAERTGNVARTFRSDTIEFSLVDQPEAHLRLSACPLRAPNQDQHILGTMFVFRDVSREHVAEQARADFVAHVSHELKAPLNVLAMYSETLQDANSDERELIVDAANVIHDEVDRLAGLINNLLNMTSIEMGTVTPKRSRVKLQDLISDVFEQARRGDRDGDLTFELNLPRDLTPVQLDKELFRVALNNLLSNAVKYSREQGIIRVSAVETPAGIEISVWDNGVGISEQDQQRIFDKFYRSDDHEVRARAGHGLGLTLCREIVRLHSGELRVRSEPGKYTEFTVSLEKDAGLLKQAI